MAEHSKRKICVVTGTRADYGLLYWLMKEIAGAWTPPPAAIRFANRDPVCGMAVTARGGFKAVLDGARYRFCSEECRRRFLRRPELFLGERQDRERP